MKSFEQVIKNSNVKLEKQGEDGGVFWVKIGSSEFCIVASFDGGWDHVSASIYNKDRCPKWSEMCEIKDIFFDDNETVVQYHPAKKDYVNNHPYVLHLWKLQKTDLPKPPKIFV
jgi:hypothetical protein